MVSNANRSNVNIKESTIIELIKLKSGDNESYNSLIKRLFNNIDLDNLFKDVVGNNHEQRYNITLVKEYSNIIKSIHEKTGLDISTIMNMIIDEYKKKNNPEMVVN